MAAPECTHSSCSNRTWNPDGQCHLHTGQVGQGSDSPSVPDTPEGIMDSSPSSGYSTEIHDQARGAFPDLDDTVHPGAIREQSVLALRSAVSVEVYRRFPQIDVEDPEQRQSLLC